MTRLPASIGIIILGVWLLIFVGWRPIAEQVSLACQCESPAK